MHTNLIILFKSPLYSGKGDLAELAEWQKHRNFHLGQQVHISTVILYTIYKNSLNHNLQLRSGQLRPLRELQKIEIL